MRQIALSIFQTVSMRIDNMRIISRNEIESLNHEAAYQFQKEGFAAFASGDLIQPPVAHLELVKGSLHIKYGMIKGDSNFVVKHATGFSENWTKGLPTGDGFLSVFCATTGLLRAIILDQGFLTDLRTALAVRLSAEFFAPKLVHTVGVIGTGNQARLSAEQQAKVTGCKKILVWGRNKTRLEKYRKDMEASGFNVTIAGTPELMLKTADLIITATSSRAPILSYTKELKTRLIIAVGADEKGKNEIDSKLLSHANRLIADDPVQCVRIGEFQHSVFDDKNILSLGKLLKEPSPTETGLTTVDLTGLAVQDIQMVKSALEHLKSDHCCSGEARMGSILK